MGEYQSVSCAFHEQLELSVLRGRPLVLTYRSGAEERREEVMPLDVATREGAEWLSFRRRDGAEGVIRLDLILAATELGNRP
jgi:Rho-binding antiterminator